MNHRRKRPRRKRFPDRFRWNDQRLRVENVAEESPVAILDNWREDEEREIRERDFNDTWEGFTDEDFPLILQRR